MSDPLSDVEIQQSELRADLDAVRRYGEEHPADWAGLKFDNGEVVRIVAAFSAETDQHRSRLWNLVDHPDRLEVVHLSYSTRQLQTIMASIRDDLRTHPDGPLMGSGLGWGHITLRLVATAQDVAAQLTTRYGPALEITVGSLPYPSGRRVEYRPGPAPLEPVDIPGLSAEIVLDDTTLPSGTTARGRVVLRNGGPAQIRVDSEEPLVASLLEVGSGRKVGAFSGAIAGTGWSATLGPGDEASIHLLVGTDSSEPTLGYVLPAGEYLVHAQVPVSLGRGAGRKAIPVPDLLVRIEPAARKA